MPNGTPDRFRSHLSPLERLLARVAVAVDRKVRWDRLPLPISLAVLIGVRDNMREHNLYDTEQLPSTGPRPQPPLPPDGRHLTARTDDGTFNDLQDPLMGSAGMRFGRNVPLQYTMPEPQPGIMEPNPRTVSRELLTREQFIPATTLNVLAAAWLQFMIRDWFSHGKSPKDNPWRIEIQPGDDWPDRPMTILRTMDDPRRPADATTPPTHVNTESPWWDASQIYGSSTQDQAPRRTGHDGKLRLEDGMIPAPMLQQLGAEPGWWVGLAMMQTLFAREHNAICDRLRAEYPNWSDDDLFDKARLINAALLAKIHTVEWTPAIISHPTTVYALRANWWGVEGERLSRAFGRLSDSEVVSGIPGSATDHHTAPYSLTEEFVAVYRMHPLIPDEFDFRSAGTDRGLEHRTFRDVNGHAVQPLLGQISLEDLFYSFGTEHPGAVTLHNFPRFLQHFERPDGILQDLASTDILRSRELGVPRYNQFRRLISLNPARTFEEMTDNPAWAEELRRVYGDVEQVDLTVGMFAEPKPVGFGFSDTAFRIFILMASRRLKSDRFFTTDFTPRVYTQAGMDWIANNSMGSVILRHFPHLNAALRTSENAFAPWTRAGS